MTWPWLLYIGICDRWKLPLLVVYVVVLPLTQEKNVVKWSLNINKHPHRKGIFHSHCDNVWASSVWPGQLLDIRYVYIHNIEPLHAILVLIAYAQRPPLNAHPDVPSGPTCTIFGLRLYLHPYFVYASSEGSCESVQLHRLDRAFVARQCDTCKKYVMAHYVYKQSWHTETQQRDPSKGMLSKGNIWLETEP